MVLFNELQPGQNVTNKFLLNVKKILENLQKITIEDILIRKSGFSPFAVLKQDFLSLLNKYEADLRSIKASYYLEKLEKIKNAETPAEHKRNQVK